MANIDRVCPKNCKNKIEKIKLNQWILFLDFNLVYFAFVIFSFTLIKFPYS